MLLEFNWPDHLIPLVVKHPHHGYMFDLFINSILFENDEPATRRITRIVADFSCGGIPVWRWELPQPALWDHIRIGAILAGQPLEIREYLTGSYLSAKIGVPCQEPVLKPNDQCLLRWFPVRFTTHKLPDTLIVRVFSGTHLIGRRDIHLQTSLTGDLARFPVSGVWQVVNNFDNVFAHRQCASREFGIDLIQISPRGTIRNDRTGDPSDFISFGKDVLAMASGTVAATVSRFPDNPPGKPRVASDLEMRSEGSIESESGNSVLIAHEGSRWCFYSHLMQDSISVKPGDQVKTGSVIGKVGNSGSSSAAHLHVQMNCGANPFADRSVPIRFNNLFNVFNEPIQIISQNLAMVHTGRESLIV